MWALPRRRPGSRNEQPLVGGCFLGKDLTVQSRGRSGSLEFEEFGVTQRLCSEAIEEVYS